MKERNYTPLVFAVCASFHVPFIVNDPSNPWYWTAFVFITILAISPYIPRDRL